LEMIPRRSRSSYEQPHAAQLQVTMEDFLDGFGLARVDHKTVIDNVVAQRYRAAHPHPPALGSGDLVPNPLSGYLPLELRVRQQHVERLNEYH
jgi:hypothetical protein